MILIRSEIAPEIWRGSVPSGYAFFDYEERCCKQLQNPLSVFLDVARSEDWLCELCCCMSGDRMGISRVLPSTLCPAFSYFSLPYTPWLNLDRAHPFEI
ncbi:hypothetical protein SADUNF_Sadunf07G0023200 [Salix dunnii]|uniref:Uncharacterized protein n=1 Tax=Salix dunnii TaxID=1413687 RepID=A0A835K115_9ROSI|nr:hypothetical protein SADUNF_Sadunf07G0023200 [Salix dunnii]